VSGKGNGVDPQAYHPLFSPLKSSYQ